MSISAQKLQFCSNTTEKMLLGKWEGKKLPCVGSLDGKTAAVVAAKCLRDDSNSSDEEIHALEHVSGSKHDHDSATKAKHRSQV